MFKTGYYEMDSDTKVENEVLVNLIFFLNPSTFFCYESFESLDPRWRIQALTSLVDSESCKLSRCFT